MEIRIDNISKRYVHRWVLRNLSIDIPSASRVAITGPNGSGKSTLLKILSGALLPSAGKLSFRANGRSISLTELYEYVSLAAPYSELIEEMTLREAVAFHKRFRPFHPELPNFQSFMDRLRFSFLPDQKMQEMSNGMKQRIRLAFAACTESSLLLLDEPTSHLDNMGVQWFHDLIDDFGRDKTVIIASNVPEDLVTCSLRVQLG
jgi:ABC-type multidrug transport system ATPase subunit